MRLANHCSVAVVVAAPGHSHKHNMSEHAGTCTISERFPSRLGAHHRTLEQILTHLRRLKWSDEDVFGIHMALEESLTNAIHHGNGLDEAKYVEFECRIGPSELWAQIRDEGEGFKPDEVPDPTDDDHLEIPGGRGLMLMRAYMTDVRYNDAGNCVTMVKRLSPVD